MEIRKIPPGYGRRIAEIHRNAFAANQWRYTIFASTKIDHYLDSLLVDAQHKFIGAFANDEMTAYMHICNIVGQPHLNYIAVQQSAHSSGIGRKLLRCLFRISEKQGVHELTLDVSENKETLRTWYEREGFKLSQRVSLFLVNSSAGTQNQLGYASISISSAQQEKYECFGLCKAVVSVDDKEYSVGLIGNALFRIVDQHDLKLVAALQQLDPAREILIIVPDDDCLNCDATLYDRSLRMVRKL